MKLNILKGFSRNTRTIFLIENNISNIRKRFKILYLLFPYYHYQHIVLLGFDVGVH